MNCDAGLSIHGRPRLSRFSFGVGEQEEIAAIHSAFCEVESWPVSLMEYAGWFPITGIGPRWPVDNADLTNHGLTCLVITSLIA